MQNVFSLFCPAEEASVKHLKVQLLMTILNEYRGSGVSLTAFASRIEVSAPRACNLVKGHLEKFSLEFLHRVCLRLGFPGLSM